VTEPFPCAQADIQTGQKCGQMIVISETELHNSGRRKVKNFYDGIGGFRGQDHVCPYRIANQHQLPDWKEYHRLQEKKFCVTCGVQYHTTAFLLCPNCFKISCRECKRLRTWKTDDVRCPMCLCLTFDVIQTYPKIDALIEKMGVDIK